ncbi:MAG: hypothetical protein M0Q88_00140 [Bacilli bacterium]|nr:hypothetical protein [Bacilli bacterium]
MKKVFSVERYKKDCKEADYTEEMINDFCESWANECDGLTEKEMRNLRCSTRNDWMIEVEEIK